MITREEYRKKVMQWYKENKANVPMKMVLMDMGVTHIQQEIFKMAVRGVSEEEIKAYSDKRIKELKETLNITD